jgi:peptidyl-prolyl cis-trans isomerase D
MTGWLSRVGPIAYGAPPWTAGIVFMLATFRRFASTWPARLFFMVLVAAFGSWGIADVVRNVGAGSSAVATVEGHDISPQDFMQEYDGDLRRYAEQLGDPTQIPPALKQRVAVQALQKLVTQQALADQEARMGLTVPDSALREAVFAMREFKGPDGNFSRGQMLQVLSSSHLTEARFLDLMRKDLAQNQLLQTIGAGAGGSKILTDLTYKYLKEKRSVDMLALPFQGQPLPPAPSDAVLHRYYDNHPDRYTAPEYRHIKAVILSPDTIGRGLDVSDADIHAYFTAHKGDYVTAEKRSLQVITTGSAAVAQTLAAKWRAGASWQQIQDAAKAAGATAIDLPDSTKDQIPSPELAKAAFAAPDGSVQGPVTEPLGAQIFRVTNIVYAKNPSFESLRDELRRKAASGKALDVIDARAQKLQDLFAGGAKIDEVPAELGAAGAAGTLDAKGQTQDGTPAPIPAPDDVRQQIVDAAFKTNPGDPIQPVEGPGHVWYAVAVDSITKPARKPFEQVRSQVRADWQADQIHRRQESEAARLVTLVKGGQSLQNAAWGSGKTVTRSQPLLRDQPQQGLTAEQVHKVFTMKVGEASMFESATGFVVVQLAEIIPPDPKADPEGVAQTEQGLNRALHDDYLTIYATALQQQAKPTVRMNVVENLISQNQ